MFFEHQRLLADRATSILGRHHHHLHQERCLRRIVLPSLIYRLTRSSSCTSNTFDPQQPHRLLYPTATTNRRLPLPRGCRKRVCKILQPEREMIAGYREESGEDRSRLAGSLLPRWEQRRDGSPRVYLLRPV
jgi:uncharacterized membrane protein YccC